MAGSRVGLEAGGTLETVGLDLVPFALIRAVGQDGGHGRDLAAPGLLGARSGSVGAGRGRLLAFTLCAGAASR